MPAGLKRLLAAVDRWQRRNRVVGPTYGVIKKFGDDTANLLVVGMAWYGFTAIYPLLLVVITIFGFIGQKSLGTGIVSTLHEFPVIGTQFNTSPGSAELHGSVFGLVIGLAGLLYGAQGVTQTCQQAMATAWNVPRGARPGFAPRLGRSLAGLMIIGLSFLITAYGSSLAAVGGRSWALRLPIILVLLAINIGLYLASFRVLTPGEIPTRALRPGAVLGGGAFTALTTLGTTLIQHQLKHSTATYGALASVIGVVTYLLLLAKISMYSAELNPVLARRLWPRALPTAEKTEADDRAAQEIARRDGVDPQVRAEPQPEDSATPGASAADALPAPVEAPPAPVDSHPAPAEAPASHRRRDSAWRATIRAQLEETAMSLKDRLRETAAQAQEGLAKGQARLEQFQNRQATHDDLQALGQAYWLQQSGRATPEQLQALLEAVAPSIQEGERRLGPLTWPTPPTPAALPGPASPAGPAGSPAPPTAPVPLTAWSPPPAPAAAPLTAWLPASAGAEPATAPET